MPDILRYDSPKICPTILYAVNLGLKPVSATGQIIGKSYKYLGVLLTDTLDYNVMVKSVTRAANKALGLLISKAKLNGGVHYKCFTQMFDTFVWPVISYRACIWGTRKYGE